MTLASALVYLWDALSGSVLLLGAILSMLVNLLLTDLLGILRGHRRWRP